MMSLIARVPSNVPSSTSVSPGKRSHGNQNPWSSTAEKEEGRERRDVTSWRTTRESQPRFSHEETQHDGTAQSVVNEVIPSERSGRPDVDPEREARPQQFVIGNDETE